MHLVVSTHARRLLAFRPLLRLLALTALLPTVAHASDHLDIQAELLRPGVRLLAVEFYRTDCIPCMKAVPEWKRLHEKYRDRGLRFVVVSVEQDGRCANLNWTPDANVCDAEGHIAEMFKIEALPQAYLWSWTGQLLVRSGHVAEVEAAVTRELQRLPRVTVVLAGDATKAQLGPVKAMVRDALATSGKVDVLATEEDQKLIAGVRRASQAAGIDEATQCQLGAEIAANSLVKIELLGRADNAQLSLQLVSAERGCLAAVGNARWMPANPQRSAAAAVDDLLQKLTVELQMPGGSGVARQRAMPTQRGPQVSGGQVDGGANTAKGPVISGGDVSAALGHLIVKAIPKEATVQVTGPEKFREVGAPGWDRADLIPGSYVVEVAAAGYEAQKQVVTLAADDAQVVKIALQRLGGLEISGTPAGAKVEVRGPDGFSAVQGLPLMTIGDAPKGSYSVKVSKAGFESAEFNPTVRLGETARLTVALKQPGTLEVRGTPLGAEVKIAGPNGFSLLRGLPVKIEGAASGEYRVTVRRDGYSAFNRAVVVSAGQTQTVEVSLEKQSEAGPFVGRYSGKLCTRVVSGMPAGQHGDMPCSPMTVVIARAPEGTTRYAWHYDQYPECDGATAASRVDGKTAFFGVTVRCRGSVATWSVALTSLDPNRILYRSSGRQPGDGYELELASEGQLQRVDPQ